MSITGCTLKQELKNEGLIFAAVVLAEATLCCGGLRVRVAVEACFHALREEATKRMNQRDSAVRCGVAMCAFAFPQWHHE